MQHTQCSAAGRTLAPAGQHPFRVQHPRRQHARQLTRCEVAKPGGGARFEDDGAQGGGAPPIDSECFMKKSCCIPHAIARPLLPPAAAAATRICRRLLCVLSLALPCIAAQWYDDIHSPQTCSEDGMVCPRWRCSEFMHHSDHSPTRASLPLPPACMSLLSNQSGPLDACHKLPGVAGCCLPEQASF